MRLPIHRRLFYSHFLAVILVSGSIGTLFYRMAVSSLHESLRARLMNSAALLARTLDAAEFEGIRTADDALGEPYLSRLASVRDFQAANRDIAFVYVMRRDGDRISFVVDSDASADQALPGAAYGEEVPALRRGFDELSADDEITKDRWGWFLSGYAPLRNGVGRYLVGIDMRADEVARKFRRLRIAGVLSLLLSILLAYGFSRVLAARLTRPILHLAARAHEIAEGRLEGTVVVPPPGDEIADLAAAFNTMSQHLAESDDRDRRSLAQLEEARSTLEARVIERTARLAETNTQLLAEIEERERAQEALAQAARTDHLTGLLNRRAMLELLERESERVRRQGSSFSLVLLDVDQFKEINDTFGHEVGDQALVHIAELVRHTVRGQDAVARWGGEELLVFLPATPVDGALLTAEKIRAVLADAVHQVAGRALSLRASLGVSALRSGEPLRDCIRRADLALYRAKAGGRNQVVAAAE